MKNFLFEQKKNEMNVILWKIK